MTSEEMPIFFNPAIFKIIPPKQPKQQPKQPKQRPKQPVQRPTQRVLKKFLFTK